LRSAPAPKLLLPGIVIWLAMLGCQITNMVTLARVAPTATRAPTQTAARPTFTPAPPIVASSPTIEQPFVPPTNPPSPVPASTARPAPTRTRTPVPPPVAAAPPAPTADPYEGYYYRVTKNVCATDTNTRIEGTVLNNGSPQNGVRVRLSNGKYDTAVIDDFITGTDPSDAKHIAPEWQGRYRLSPAEGQRMDGNWWVFIIDKTGQPISVAAYVKTHDGPGCNTATVDFAH
jgi:hypothetical protein